MPKSSEIRDFSETAIPQIKERKPQLKVIPEVVKEVKKEMVEKIPYKVQKKIAKKVAACISAGFVASTGGFIALGETGHLPEHVQEWYDGAATGIRAVFGIEEEKREQEIIIDEEIEIITPIENISPALEKTTQETAPATTEISKESKTEVNVGIKESEFDLSMVKNGLTFPIGVPIIPEYPWFVDNGPVPLWFVKEYVDNAFVASGVVAGPLKKEIGFSGKEEVMLPLAFQNPKNRKFYIRDISFGTEEVIQAVNRLGGWPTVLLKDYQYIGGKEGWLSQVVKFEDFSANFQVGDQIAVGFKMIYTPPDGISEEEYRNIIEKNPDAKMVIDFDKSYWPNNKIIYETMKENKDLPDLKIFPTYIFVEKIEKEK